MEQQKLVSDDLDVPTRVYGVDDKKKTIEGVTIWIEASEVADPEKLKFTYSYKDFSDENLSLQLHFEYPEYISLDHKD